VSKKVSKFILRCSNGLNSHESAKSCSTGWTKHTLSSECFETVWVCQIMHEGSVADYSERCVMWCDTVVMEQYITNLTKWRFFAINVLFYHYSASSILLSM